MAVTFTSSSGYRFQVNHVDNIQYLMGKTSSAVLQIGMETTGSAEAGQAKLKASTI